MKFVVKSTGKTNLIFGAKSTSTNGNGIFDKLKIRNSKDVKKILSMMTESKDLWISTL